MCLLNKQDKQNRTKIPLLTTIIRIVFQIVRNLLYKVHSLAKQIGKQGKFVAYCLLSTNDLRKLSIKKREILVGEKIMNQLKAYGLTESKLLEAIGEHLGTDVDAIKYIRTIS